jgi:hypothetical protein
MRASSFVICCLAALLSTATVLADKAVPDETLPPDEKPAVSEPANLIVRKDVRAKTSRIIIPAKYIASAGTPDPKVGVLSPTRSIVAGVALSAAIAGVFIAARRGKRMTTAAIVLGIVAVGAVTSAVADIRLPDEEERKAQIIVEVVPDGDEVVLVQGIDFGR